jgi:hypothetical protein
VGSRLLFDGEPMQVAELLDRDVLLRGANGVRRVPLVTILDGRHDGVRLLDVAEEDEGLTDPAAEVLGQLSEEQLQLVRDRAWARSGGVLTGFRSGTAELACKGEPRDGYDPETPLNTRYALKAAELGVSDISVRRWVRAFHAHGEAGLMDGRGKMTAGSLGNADPRWLEAGRTVLAEQVESSTKTKSLILRTVTARLEQQFGPGVVPIPTGTTSALG